MNVEELRKLYSELNKLRAQHISWAREDVDKVLEIVKNDIEYAEKLLKTAQNMKEFVKNSEKNAQNPYFNGYKDNRFFKLD